MARAVTAAIRAYAAGHPMKKRPPPTSGSLPSSQKRTSGERRTTAATIRDHSASASGRGGHL